MDIRLLYLDGCPHVSVVEVRLKSALAIVGRGEETIQHVLVETPEDAERLGFIGSPTVLVDGTDPFATGDEHSALACRMFSTPDGRAGSPTVEQLAQVLSGDVPASG
ncbi:thioredoxin family protein [Knoellia sp. S7-12]|uniref:thioredoxin family protein n=1 Tax=Knoellia sp. S7-12 TaxID=3126698 RepID=UPI003368AB3A